MLAHDRGWQPGYDFLFLLYRTQNDRTKQEAILRQHVQNDPKNSLALVNLANFLAQSGRSSEADALMQRALNDPKAFPHARELVGDFYARAGKFDQARQQYEAGI